MKERVKKFFFTQSRFEKFVKIPVRRMRITSRAVNDLVNNEHTQWAAILYVQRVQWFMTTLAFMKTPDHRYCAALLTVPCEYEKYGCTHFVYIWLFTQVIYYGKLHFTLIPIV